MSSSSNPRKVILSNIKQLDEEMTKHQESCYKCSEEGPCDIWAEMVEVWNFYSISLQRALKNKFIEIPGYESGI